MHSHKESYDWARIKKHLPRSSQKCTRAGLHDFKFMPTAYEAYISETKAMGLLFQPDAKVEDSWLKSIKDELTLAHSTKSEWFLGSFLLAPSKVRSAETLKKSLEKQLYSYNQQAKVDGSDWVTPLLWRKLQDAIF